MAQVNLGPRSVADVAIIGAGPYGLSLAAHLSASGVSYRIFGLPMSVWSTQMPKGMRLKSEGFASSLSHPRSEFTLADYCRKHDLQYADTGMPVALDTFVAYGLEFQRRFVPMLEEKLVAAVQFAPAGFRLELEDGEIVLARKVVSAVGISHFGFVPSVLADLPAELVSHSSEHHDLSRFAHRRVAVVGAGASAVDLAALLQDAGASVQLVARDSAIRFHQPPRPRTLIDRAVRPLTGIGSGMQLLFYVKAPQLFRRLPAKVRLNRVRKALGPAPGWFVKDQVAGRVPMSLGMKIAGASAANGKAKLHLVGMDGQRQTVEADHVIAATGYKADIAQLTFLCPEIRKQIATVAKAPALSGNFESTVPGLYFVGPSAANTFGPLMRFAFGAHYAARRLARHLARTAPDRTRVHEFTERAAIGPAAHHLQSK